MTRLLAVWDKLRGSYWFVPTLMCLTAMMLASICLDLDHTSQAAQWKALGWIQRGSPDGARDVLSTVASSMVTVAGVTFSVTIVALTLASSQHGPRLMRRFLRDRANQAVLGTFLSTFLYCLLILRSISASDRTEDVPHLSVTVGFLLALASVAVLIFFIHHAAISLQVSNLIDVVGAELDQILDREYTQKSKPSSRNLGRDVSSGVVTAKAAGYLQAVDEATLVRLATSGRAFFAVQAMPGDFVVPGVPLLEYWMFAEDSLDHEPIRSAFLLGPERTSFQDIRFVMNQLVETALRSLSPAINDPFTAIACLDRLTSALCRVAGNPEPSLVRFDPDHDPRLKLKLPSGGSLMEEAFEPVRQASEAHPMVRRHLAHCVSVLLRGAVNESAVPSLRSLFNRIRLESANGRAF